MGKTDFEWQDTDYVFGMFGKSMGAARGAYAAFMAKGVPAGRRPELVGGGLVRSVGGWYALKDYRKTRLRLKRRVFPSNLPWQPRCLFRKCESRPVVLRPTFSSGLPLTGSVGTFQEKYR